jgi:predicted dehydrogenase
MKAAAGPRFVAVGFQAMYAPETRSLQRRLLGGEIGRVESIRCRALWPRPDRYYARNAWVGRLRVDGRWVLDSPFNNALAHYLNLTCFWAGAREGRSATPVGIQAELYRAREIESADTACLRIFTEEGPVLLFVATHCSRELLGPEIVIRGTEGTIRWTPLGIEIESRGRREGLQVSPADTMRRLMYGAVLARLSDPDQPICDLDIAAAQTLCANGAHESSAVTSIAPAHVRRVDSETGPVTVISGIEHLVAQCFEREALLSEVGAPWARAGRPIDLRRYSRYPADPGPHGSREARRD